MIQYSSVYSSRELENMANEVLNEHEGGNTSQASEDVLEHFIGPSVLITVFGTVTNLLSLSYFITQRNFNNRKSRTEVINKILFTALNVFDILVCIFLSAKLLVRIFRDGQKMSLWIIAPFIVSVQTTGFITCLLSVIRAISIIRPRHQLNVRILVGAIICYFGLIIYLNTERPEEDKDEDKDEDKEEDKEKDKIAMTARFLIVLGMFAVVILCNIVCIVKLAYSKVASWKREATITMGILSAVYCVFNTGFLVVYGFKVFKCGVDVKVCFSAKFEVTSVYILLPMNSASNPVVYFLRNREMRRYLKNVWRKMTCRRSEQEVGPEQDKSMTISNIARDRTEVTEGRDDADRENDAY